MALAGRASAWARTPSQRSPEELRRRGAISPLLGLGCPPVLVSGTKTVFLKWIGSALRRKQIRFPEENGPVRWTISNSFFRVGETDLDEGSHQDTSKANSAIPAECEGTTLCESQ